MRKLNSVFLCWESLGIGNLCTVRKQPILKTYGRVTQPLFCAYDMDGKLSYPNMHGKSEIFTDASCMNHVKNTEEVQIKDARNT